MEWLSIIKDIPLQKKHRRIGKEAQKSVHNKETVDTELDNKLIEDQKELHVRESPWLVYYRPGPDLAKRYMEERAALSRSTNQMNVGNV